MHLESSVTLVNGTGEMQVLNCLGGKYGYVLEVVEILSNGVVNKRFGSLGLCAIPARKAYQAILNEVDGFIRKGYEIAKSTIPLVYVSSYVFMAKEVSRESEVIDKCEILSKSKSDKYVFKKISNGSLVKLILSDTGNQVVSLVTHDSKVIPTPPALIRSLYLLKECIEANNLVFEACLDLHTSTLQLTDVLIENGSVLDLGVCQRYSLLKSYIKRPIKNISIANAGFSTGDKMQLLVEAKRDGSLVEITSNHQELNKGKRFIMDFKQEVHLQVASISTSGLVTLSSIIGGLPIVVGEAIVPPHLKLEPLDNVLALFSGVELGALSNLHIKSKLSNCEEAVMPASLARQMGYDSKPMSTQAHEQVQSIYSRFDV